MRINTKVISSHWTDRNRDRQYDYTFGSSLQVITATVSTIVATTFSVDDHIEYSPYKKRIPFFPLLLPPLPSLSLPSFPPLPVYLPSLISFSFQSPFPKTQVTHYRCGERCQLPQRDPGQSSGRHRRRKQLFLFPASLQGLNHAFKVQGHEAPKALRPERRRG